MPSKTTQHPHIVAAKPAIDDVENGHFVKIVIDGIYWGHYIACRNWCGDRFWMPCDDQGRLY